MLAHALDVPVEKELVADGAMDGAGRQVRPPAYRRVDQRQRFIHIGHGEDAARWKIVVESLQLERPNLWCAAYWRIAERRDAVEGIRVDVVIEQINFEAEERGGFMSVATIARANHDLGHAHLAGGLGQG